MPDLLTTVLMAPYYGGPVCLLGWLGYRYGYRQQVSRAGLAWRTLLFCCALSWSIVGGRDHDAGWAIPVPSIVGVYLLAAGWLQEVRVVPPVWVAPLFHMAFYLLSVAHGHRTRERSYSSFPGPAA
jgi:hypothetical protein